MSCITEPIKSSVIQWGLPIALLLLLNKEDKQKRWKQI
jgi:hypothetical protein